MEDGAQEKKKKKKNEKLSLYCFDGGVFDSLHHERSTKIRRRLRFSTKEILMKLLLFYFDLKFCSIFTDKQHFQW